ncbi:MAG: transposase [Planctomycetales bacterium]|nr:transposase [Planctomycetales bacterium]
MDGADSREGRGKLIAATRQLKHDSRGWLVPSQSKKDGGHYRVVPETAECNCPDYETRAVKCKHQWAVEYYERRESDGETVTVTRGMRVTYGQEWTAYNNAQVEEGARFPELLAKLCADVEQPEQSNGRPRLPLSDMLFACVYKVYTGFSSRRFTSDLAAARERGYIDRVPHFNSVSNYLANPALTPILQELVARSALPLRGIETSFAADASGFSTSRFVRWYNKKWGRMMDNREWVKAHIMVGTTTGIVTSVEVIEWQGHDSPYFMPLLESTAREWDMAEVSADKAYLSYANVEAIEKAGATPYIPFKMNSVRMQKKRTRHADNSSWMRMWHAFEYHREDFLAHYHKRSNVESAFSAIKRKFGDSVRSKSDTGQANEVLCKVLCHNLSVLIHASHTFGIEI